MKPILLPFLLLLTGCNNISHEHQPGNPQSFITVGSPSSHNAWVYLCGLIDEFAPQAMPELNILDTIGKQLDITFIVMIPSKRCQSFNNKLCWPHETTEELLHTYQNIMAATCKHSIQGYIGFSNGGFSLNKIAQYVKLNKPIISIGAAGQLWTKKGPLNTVHLLIGKKDQWHYQPALNFYKGSQDSNLKINLIEYDDGHILPASIVKNLVTKLSTKIIKS